MDLIDMNRAQLDNYRKQLRSKLIGLKSRAWYNKNGAMDVDQIIALDDENFELCTADLAEKHLYALDILYRLIRNNQADQQSDRVEALRNFHDKKYDEMIEKHSEADWRRAEDYFRVNQGSQYGGSKQGLLFSYIKTATEIVRRGAEIGRGNFGRIKFSKPERVQDQLFVTKRQNDARGNDLEKIKKEAEINVDLQVATSGLVVRRTPTGTTKVYQNMHYLGQTIEQVTTQPLALDTKLNYAIDLLLTVDDLHTGNLALSGTPYAHLDIKPQNVMIDNDGVLHLIDFGFSKKDDLMNPHVCKEGTARYMPFSFTLSETKNRSHRTFNRKIRPNPFSPNYFFDDKVATLRTIYHPYYGIGILQTQDFDSLPDPIKDLLATHKLKGIDDLPSLRLVAAVLILYKENKTNPEACSDEVINALKQSPEDQNRLITQYEQINNNKTKDQIINDLLADRLRFEDIKTRWKNDPEIILASLKKDPRRLDTWLEILSSPDYSIYYNRAYVFITNILYGYQDESQFKIQESNGLSLATILDKIVENNTLEVSIKCNFMYKYLNSNRGSIDLIPKEKVQNYFNLLADNYEDTYSDKALSIISNTCQIYLIQYYLENPHSSTHENLVCLLNKEPFDCQKANSILRNTVNKPNFNGFNNSNDLRVSFNRLTNKSLKLIHLYEKTKKEKYLKAADASFKLCVTVNHALQNYPYPNDYETFKSQLMNAAKTAKPILSSHRGFMPLVKQFVNALIIAAAALSIGGIIAMVVKNRYALYQPKTDTQRIVDKMLAEINKNGPRT